MTGNPPAADAADLPSADGDVLLRATNLSKRYGAIQAVDAMSLTVRRGEVHALIGENGAGKSTFIGMLGGTVSPDEGTIELESSEFRSLKPRQAKQLGISIVYQELTLCPNLTVAENIYIAAIPTRLGIFLNRRAMRVGATRVAQELGAELNVQAPLERMRTAERQITEIARALTQTVRVLVLDEPTSSLTHEDFVALKRIVLRLQQRGVGIIFVSHRLSEVLDLAQRVTVMRDGRLVQTLDCGATSEDELASLMVGSANAARRQAREVDPIQVAEREQVPMLEVRGLSRRGAFREVSLRLWPGEVVGIAGLRGAGRHELVDCIFGLDRSHSGEVLVSGQTMRRPNPRTARRRGVGYVPQDRKTHGIVPIWDLKRNLAIGNLNAVSSAGMIRFRRMRRWSQAILQRMGIVPPNAEAPVTSLSGGNQQKLVFGRTIAPEPSVLLLLEPTRGIDVRAKAEVANIIRASAASGSAVLMVDSELSEMLAVCDRIYVMHRGALVAEVPRETATEESITLLAAGGRQREQQAHSEQVR